MSEHTRGPWETGKRYPCRVIAAGAMVASTCPTEDEGTETETEKANAARIVACMNACEGMDDPAAEIARLRELEGEAYPGIAHDFETAKAERDEALDALDKLFSTLKVRTEPVFDARGRHTGHKLLGELEEQAASLTAHNILRKHGRLS